MKIRDVKHTGFLYFLIVFVSLSGLLVAQSENSSDSSDQNSRKKKAQKKSEKNGKGLENRKKPAVEITPESLKAMDKAVAWLIKTQNPDGSWGGEPGLKGDAAVTATVCVALLARGNTPHRGEHADALRRGLNYLLKRSDRMNPISGRHRRTQLMQAKLGKFIHIFMTAILLGQINGTTFRPVVPGENIDKVRVALKKLVKSITKDQNKAGGWDVRSYSIALTTGSAWLALRSANSAGLSVDASVKNVLSYMKSKNSDFTENTGSNDPKGFYNAAATLRVFYGMGRGDSKIAQRATSKLMKMVETGNFGRYSFKEKRVGGEEYYAALLATQGLFHTRDKRWYRWFPFIRDTLLRLQNSDGSWNGYHCITYRTFCTAVNVITLSTPNRLLPILQK